MGSARVIELSDLLLLFFFCLFCLTKCPGTIILASHISALGGALGGKNVSVFLSSFRLNLPGFYRKCVP